MTHLVLLPRDPDEDNDDPRQGQLSFDGASDHEAPVLRWVEDDEEAEQTCET